MGFKHQASCYCHRGPSPYSSESHPSHCCCFLLRLPLPAVAGVDTIHGGSRSLGWLRWRDSQLPPCFSLMKCCGSQRGLGWLQPSDGGSSFPPWPSHQHSHTCLLLSISLWTCEKLVCLWGHEWTILWGGRPGRDGRLAAPPSPPTGLRWGRRAAGGWAAPGPRGFAVSVCGEVEQSSLNGQH